MALKGNWIDKINGVDKNSADDINKVAQAVIELEENGVGGTGLPEVYVGEEAPEDGTPLWVDTDDDSVDNVLGVSGAAVGQIVRIDAVDEDGVPTKWSAVEPSEVEGVYELIDTITIEDGVTSCVVSAEPDGTAYRFERLFLKFTSGETAPAMTLQFYVHGISGTVAAIYMSKSSAVPRYAGAQVWKHNGYWDAETFGWNSVKTTYGTTCRLGETSQLLLESKNKLAEGFRIIVDGGLGGIKVEVWGVRPRE